MLGEEERRKSLIQVMRGEHVPATFNSIISTSVKDHNSHSVCSYFKSGVCSMQEAVDGTSSTCCLERIYMNR